MTLKLIDLQSWPSGTLNEDRANANGDWAWVIDGATDVLEQRLTPGPSDAAWFAAALDDEIGKLAGNAPLDMSELPRLLAPSLHARFTEVAVRQTYERSEHPSAAGLITRLNGTSLDYLALGDCSLLVLGKERLQVAGVDEAAAGDTWVADALRTIHATQPEVSSGEARASLWPKLRAKRARMNVAGGYGIFSITPPPAEFVKTGTLTMDRPCHILLASDGLMRLVDVFRCYSARQLMGAAIARGLASLLTELRELEAANSDYRRYPRAKTSDDATGMLLEVTA